MGFALDWVGVAAEEAGVDMVRPSRYGRGGRRGRAEQQSRLAGQDGFVSGLRVPARWTSEGPAGDALLGALRSSRCGMWDDDEPPDGAPSQLPPRSNSAGSGWRI